MLKNLFLSFALLVSATALSAQKSPGGYIINSYCGENNEVYYFYKDGITVEASWNCAKLFVAVGTWQYEEREIKIIWQTVYSYEGVGEEIDPSSNCASYSAYRASVGPVNYTTTVMWYDGIIEETGDDNPCERIEKFETKRDIHTFLRTEFVGKYFFASERLLTEAELKKYSASELKIMRNEIFARYGYAFTTKEMKDYFKKQPKYSSQDLTDVTAFLSDIETKNIATIKKVEATKK